MDTGKLGKFGENAAAALLEDKGYRITANNFRCRAGEIDLIAENTKFIVFAEVKLRKNNSFADAKEFVTPAKQMRIRKAAMFYLMKNESVLQPRFDVIEVYAPDGENGKITINHIEDAFY